MKRPSTKPSDSRTFRPATPADAPFILELLAEFYDRNFAVYGIPFHSPSFRKVISNVLAEGVCFVGPTSVAGAIVRPFTYNETMSVAHVAFWYFRNASEVRILETLIAGCQRLGASRIIASSQLPGDTIGRWYDRLGFVKAEATYLLAL